MSARIATVALAFSLTATGVALADPPGAGARSAVARFETRRAESVEPLRAAMKAEPLVATALQTLLADALLARGAAAEARSTAQAVIKADPRWAHRAAYVAARATLATDCRAALAYLETARVDPPWVRRAPRLALMSAAQTRCGDKETASAIDLALATDHPDTAEGRAAATRITLTDEDRLAMAAGFEKARDYGAAARILKALLDGPSGAEARFRLAVLHLDRIRDDFAEARRLFDTVVAADGPHAAEALYLRARSLGRQGDVVGALAGYRAYLAKHPTGEFAEDARFFSAFLLYEHGRYDDAAAAFEPLQARGKWRKGARWYTAWSLYLAGEHARAVPLLDAIATRGPRGRSGRQAAYWAARALEKSAPDEAARRRAALVEARPHDWYGLMIRRRHPGEHPPLPALPSGATGADGALPPAFLTRALEIQALAEAGLPDFARRALAAISADLRAVDGWDAEATLAARIGDPERLYRSTATRHRDALRAAPSPDSAIQWRGTHPRPWPEAVQGAVDGSDVHPSLVWSFIRKESAFDPDAVSPAHAVGLMQLLPRTARAILDARGQADESLPDLFDPATNIGLGSWYIDALGARFGGQLPLIAAAYNAGPRSLVSWYRGRERVETDLFVDTIPFRETREYVKLLVATRVGYALVHEGRDLDAAATVLPIELDLTLRPGVEF